jgi:hypothetical protein
MKKLLIICFVILSGTGLNAQNLFKPVGPEIFKGEQQDNRSLGLYGLPQPAAPELPGKWLLRLNTGVMGVSYELTKGSQPVPFSAIGFGAGYYYFKNVNGEPFNVWGVNALLLTNTNNAGLGAGVYGVYNTNAVGLLNLGAHYDFSVNKAFIDTGITFKF